MPSSSGTTAVIPPADVIDSYAESIAAGMRAFLLFEGDVFAGDADCAAFAARPPSSHS